jgi:hypothetical protein
MNHPNAREENRGLWGDNVLGQIISDIRLEIKTSLDLD